MVNPRSKKTAHPPQPMKRGLSRAVIGGPAPLDPTQELKNSDPLDVSEEMMENVFDRDPESR